MEILQELEEEANPFMGTPQSLSNYQFLACLVDSIDVLVNEFGSDIVKLL